MCDVNIRLLKDNDEDYKLLEKWYQQEEIYSSFEQRKLNYKEIKEKYYPRTLKTTKIPVYMVEYKDNPVGIIQYKLVEEEDKKLYKLTGNNIYEIDIFIGELKEHNKGIGSKAINILSKLLKKEKNAELLVMCPLKNNIKAINCYKKCDFYIKDYFNTKDTIGISQTYALMVEKRIRLVPFKKCINKDLYNMYQDISVEEIGSENKFNGISYTEFIKLCNELTKEETIINKEINTTTSRFILCDSDKPIGEVGIRTTLNDFWQNRGSQIYYKIRKSERQKGYGNIILNLALQESKKLGFNKIRINCDDNNIPSKKIILKNGGIVDIKSYKTKEGTSSSYIIDL